MATPQGASPPFIVPALPINIPGNQGTVTRMRGVYINFFQPPPGPRIFPQPIPPNVQGQ
jgi:hypothetical protein